MSAAALADIRVLDLTRYIPGPYCTMLLGDLGADVVKVEEPGLGDPTRAVPPVVGEDGATHAALNRNKRSVALDMRSEAGAAAIRRLAERSDVLVESFRPGVMARHGLGAETLCELNPRLVYCSLSGYGQGGPLAHAAGHDVNYLALAGLLGTNRAPDGRPVLPTAQLADMTGALFATIGILAALQARERIGRGQVVDTSIYASVMALMTVPATRLMAGGSAVDELGGTQACYNVYRCRDGRYLSVGALESKFWRSLCEALELPERKARQWERGERAVQAVAALAEVFAARDRDEWVRVLRAHDVCVEPVLDLDEALAHPQALALLATQPTGETHFDTVAPPIRLSHTEAEIDRPAPGLGEHTAEVLAEAGFSASEIAQLAGAAR